MELGILPTEIIHRICTHLCDHCDSPHSFPHAETWDVRGRKAALANLSTTSSRFRDIAQPVLFHYFASGTLPPRGYSPEYDSKLTREFSERARKLPLFLRSAVQRPDLASRVKALQLVQSKQTDDEIPDVLGEYIRTMLAEAYCALNNKTGEDRDLLKESVDYWSHRIWFRPDSHLLIQVALLLAPNIERLAIARDFYAGYDLLEICNGALPSLKSIALRPWMENYHIHDAKPLFAAAPKLETLYALGCGFKDEANNPNHGVPFELDLANLRKLIISGLEFYDLAMLLPTCPQLEELQYVRPTTETEFNEDITPLETLMPIRETLRKLRIKFTRFSVWGQLNQTFPRTLTTIESFKDFTALEELTIEQAAINCPVSPTPGGARLVDWLPPSVQRVHFRDVTDGVPLLDHLSILVSEALAKLPKLQAVGVTPLRWRETDAGWESSVDRVTTEFGQAGLTFVQVDPDECWEEPWLELMYPELVGKIKGHSYF